MALCYQLSDPHCSGFKKLLSWTQVFRKLLMGRSILHHVLLMGKLTTSVPKAISVHQSSLSLSTSNYYALTCGKHIFKWKTPWQTLADERGFYFKPRNQLSGFMLGCFIRILPKESSKQVPHVDHGNFTHPMEDISFFSVPLCHTIVIYPKLHLLGMYLVVLFWCSAWVPEEQ